MNSPLLDKSKAFALKIIKDSLTRGGCSLLQNPNCTSSVFAFNEINPFGICEMHFLREKLLRNGKEGDHYVSTCIIRTGSGRCELCGG